MTGMKVNGTATTHDWVPESFAQSGGTLNFTMSATPEQHVGHGGHGRAAVLPGRLAGGAAVRRARAGW